MNNDCNISGKIISKKGSAISGAVVALTADEFRKTTISSKNGHFQFTQIPSESYDIECVLEGFEAFIQKGIYVEPGKSINLSIMMHYIGFG